MIVDTVWASLSLILFQLPNLHQMRKGKERHDGEAYPIVKICSAFGFISMRLMIPSASITTSAL